MQRLQLLLWICATFSVHAVQGQCIKGDCNNLISTYVFPSGAKYEGGYLNGQPHGKGKLYYTDGRIYTGDFKYSYFAGRGEMFFPDSSVYVGGFKRGLRSGIGVLKEADGDIFSGEWENDELHGKVEFTSHTGYRYKGKWHKGKPMDQQGLCISEGHETPMSFQECRELNGEIQEDHIVEARGAERDDTYKFKDGSTWIGPRKDGIPHGYGTCVFVDGRKYKGMWKKNYPHGMGALYYEDGTVRYGVWDTGRLAEERELPPEIVAEIIQPHESKDVKVWAVLVGVSYYDALPSLKYSDDDAYLMYAFYKSPEGGALADNQISILVDENATRKNIIDALRKTAAMADSNDVFIFYFSGHGLRDNLVAQDYNGVKNLISNHEIMEIIDASAAKQKLCYVDACYAGSMNGVRAGNRIEETVTTYYKAFDKLNAGTALILSSKESEISLENAGLRQGVFSHYLIKGLKGEADKNGDNIVDVNELYEYIHQNVIEYTQGRQTPVLTGSYDERMPVGAIRQ